ncbi:PAS domain-containing sensor histidine kinase [Cellvibrio mixtus]|uniref:histidine kinase n=1 Tax=Cellvibrio mixtus TaxID=39650 RepID=A0A266Q763_9GAMM|nr:PAS domain-containing sensor histidine kinase [Cellvibrio mixtus]OZY85682.1 PAS domain-containing sensor histidine kinase [Cellvibrio mixtus]
MLTQDETQESGSDFTRELLDAVPAGIIVSRQDGSISYINEEAGRLFGYSRAELINQNIELLLPDRFSGDHAQLRQSYLQQPSTRYMGAGRDLYGKRKDHTEFPLEIGLRPLIADGERFVVATIVNITRRKQLEERLSAVIDASPYGQLLVDDKGIIQLINPSLLALFGYEKTELLGKSMDILLPERYREGHQKLRDGYAQKPSLRAMGLGRDLTGRHKNGTEIPIEIGLSPVDSDAGKMTLAVVTDISERKRLELNLKQANAHLEEFTYVASHDLKSPLRGIADLVEWIGEDLGTDTPEPVLNNIGRIKIRIGRMERLIEDLLLYARAGRRHKESSAVNVPELISNIIEMHPVPAGFTIKQDIRINEIFAAKTPLETVLRNLFSNALKHHHGTTPEIVISAESSGSYCLFKVTDNGPGIPEIAQERVFRLFQTLTSNDNGGSGIGLALAKRLTESHGGQIELISNSERPGCSFHVWWPRFSRKDIDD